MSWYSLKPECGCSFIHYSIHPAVPVSLWFFAVLQCDRGSVLGWWRGQRWGRGSLVTVRSVHIVLHTYTFKSTRRSFYTTTKMHRAKWNSLSKLINRYTSIPFQLLFELVRKTEKRWATWCLDWEIITGPLLSPNWSILNEIKMC